MIERRIKQQVTDALDRQAAVALIGPRQVGKTTFVREIVEEVGRSELRFVTTPLLAL